VSPTGIFPHHRHVTRLTRVTMESGPRFDGSPGNSPQDYIDDVVLAAEDRAGPGATEDKITARTLSLFRTGLQGNARVWYSRLTESQRRDWPQLQKVFREKFPLTAIHQDNSQAARIDNFQRRADEDLVDFINRSLSLSLVADAKQMRKLRNRFFKHMCHAASTAAEVRFQERVQDQLVAIGKIDSQGDLTDDCTYNDIKDRLIFVMRKPGQDNPWLDRIHGYTSFIPDANPMRHLAEQLAMYTAGSQQHSQQHSRARATHRRAGS